MNTKSVVALGLALMASAVFGLGQAADLQVRQAELAIPFGSVKGNLFVVGNYLLFVDEKAPEHSFAIASSQIKSLNAEAEMLQITTRVPVTDRSGERSELVFKLREPLELGDWLDQPLVAATAESAPKSEAEPAQSYSVQHKHRFGECQGRLLITEAGLSYESVGDLSHSRKWSFSDIKTLKLKNPYELNIEPFAGNGYNLRLQGQGMDGKTFEMLVDRITASRAGL